MSTRPNTTLTFTNLTLTTSGTGYSFTVPADCKAFSFQARTAVDLKVGKTQASVESGGTGYVTIKSGTVWNSPERFANVAEVYWFSAGSNSIVVEIVTWA